MTTPKKGLDPEGRISRVLPDDFISLVWAIRGPDVWTMRQDEHTKMAQRMKEKYTSQVRVLFFWLMSATTRVPQTPARYAELRDELIEKNPYRTGTEEEVPDWFRHWRSHMETALSACVRVAAEFETVENGS